MLAVYNKALIASLLLIPCCLLAQTAEDYFHGAAQFYVFGQKQRAMTEVATGLSRFPNDPKLNGLAGFMKKKEEEQKQQQQKRNQEKGDQNNEQEQKSQSQEREKDKKQ